MRKLLFALMLVLFCLPAYAGEIKLQVNGQEVTSSMQYIDGTIYVPINTVAESMGATAEWDKENNTVKLVFSENMSSIFGILKELDKDPKLFNVIADAVYYHRYPTKVYQVPSQQQTPYVQPYQPPQTPTTTSPATFDDTEEEPEQVDNSAKIARLNEQYRLKKELLEQERKKAIQDLGTKFALRTGVEKHVENLKKEYELKFSQLESWYEEQLDRLR